MDIERLKKLNSTNQVVANAIKHCVENACKVENGRKAENACGDGASEVDEKQEQD